MVLEEVPVWWYLFLSLSEGKGSLGMVKLCVHKASLYKRYIDTDRYIDIYINNNNLYQWEGRRKADIPSMLRAGPQTPGRKAPSKKVQYSCIPSIPSWGLYILPGATLPEMMGVCVGPADSVSSPHNKQSLYELQPWKSNHCLSDIEPEFQTEAAAP